MRLSATERIIREAEEQDAGPASSRNRDSGRVAEASPTTVTARNTSRSHSWAAPSDVEVDVDVDIEGLTDDDDKTLVNEERAAAALQEMRSYEALPRRPPSSSAALLSSTNALLEDRPTPLAPAPKSPVGVLPGLAPAPKSPVGVLPGLASPRALESTETRSEPRTLFTMPPSFEAVQPRHGVGRRMGIVIAAVTAIVALGVGAWTTDSGHLAIDAFKRGWPASSGVSVIRSARVPRAQVAAVIVPTTPEVLPPEALLAPQPAPTPALAPAPTPAPPPVSVPASATAHSSTPDLGSPVSASASAATPRKQPSATDNRPRPSRKLTPHKSRWRKSHTAKVSAPRSRANRAVEVASPPSIRTPGAIPRNVDPDSTLPITD